MHSISKYLFILFICFGFSVSSTYADTVTVTSVNQYEIEEMNLEPGQLADVTVHLRSAGDPVDGFRVLYINSLNGRLVAADKTDQHGVVKFTRIEPGEYNVYLEMPEELKGRTSTGLGDIVLSVSEFGAPVVKEPRLKISDK